MIGKGFSHDGWDHIAGNVAVLLLWQLRPHPPIDTLQRTWDSPVMFFVLFFGGCAAGSAAEIFLAGWRQRQVQARTAAAADAANQALSCPPNACIPGLSAVWNSAVSFLANTAARLRFLPEHLTVHRNARCRFIGASDGVYSVSAAAAVRSIAEFVVHDSGEELGTLRALLPVVLLAGSIENEVRMSVAALSLSGGSDNIAHAAHVGGAAFGLAAALIAPLAVATARSLARAAAPAGAPSPPLAPSAGPGRAGTAMSPW